MTLLYIILFFVLIWLTWELIHSLLGTALVVIGIFAVAWTIWYLNDGPTRFESSNQGIFIRPNADYTKFETYGTFPVPPGLKN